MSRSVRLAPRLYLLAALAVPAAALDAAADAVDNHGVWLGKWADRANAMLADPARYRAQDGPIECEAAIAEARADGIGETQRVASYNFKGHPKAQPVQGRMVWSLTLDEVSAYCDSIRVVEVYAKERKVFDDTATTLAYYENDRNVQAVAIPAEHVADAHALAAECRTAWDQLHALGIPDDLPGGGRLRHAFGAIRAEVCDPLDGAVDAFAAQSQQEADQLRERWERFGFAGDKLDIMMEYSGVYWYLSGGDRTDDPKRLARAKVTFLWLTHTDRDTGYPVHTIRKYRWKGNKLAGVSERVYYGSVGDRVFR